MKIKDVIEKTGLTDRAIRLYIDEGLIAPSIGESYSGRKSIEFSQEDVERLKNVAMLRKAGFPIADIKSIVDDESTIKSIVEKFIEQTEENIAHETEIVEKLKGISFDTEVTLETVCRTLSETVEEKQLPKEDEKLTAAEKILKILAIIIACPMLVISVFFIVLATVSVFDVRYIKIWNNYENLFLSPLYLGWVVIAIFLLYIIFRNIGKGFNRKMKGTNAAMLTISAAGTFVMVCISLFCFFCTVTPFCSQTDDPNNYLQLDKYLIYEDGNFKTLEGVYKIFPRRIPREAKYEYTDSVKYFYEYIPLWGGTYISYDICAEWTLPAGEYEKAKNDLPGNFILEERINEINDMYETEKVRDYYINSATNNDGYKVVQKGDWTMIYYDGYGQVRFDYNLPVGRSPVKHCEDELLYEESKNEFEIKNWEGKFNSLHFRTEYDFLICAYNDKEQKVRYIASSCRGPIARPDGPYYLSLDW